MTWQEQAAAIIGNVHKGLPDDASLADRKKALKAARPHEFRVTSWGCKTWCRAQREYLAKFGQKPRGSSSMPMSPLERMIARAKARAAE